MLIKNYQKFSMNIKLAKSEIIHFVGIGGIGMSGLSLIMKGKGFKVQGSDISNNKNSSNQSNKTITSLSRDRLGVKRPR